jgi:hypothetical protein
MVTEVRPVQLANAYDPIVSTLSGILRDVREPQLLNACSPILVTLLPMVKDSRLLHP